MKLYHFPASTCSQKVRVALAEKGVAFESRVVNLLAGEQHSPDYVKLNPAHVVPTAVVEDVVLTESSLINEFIDDHFDGPSLRSSDSFERYHSAALVRYVDLQIHGKVGGVPTHAVLTRGILVDRTPEQIAAYLAAIPDPADRALRESLLTHGVAAPEMQGALRIIAQFIRRLEARLSDGREWLSGEAFGLADAGVLPYVIRFRDIGLDAYWDDGASPQVADWIDRSTGRDSFAEAFTKWMPAEMAATFQRLAVEARPALAPMIHSAIAAPSKE